MLWLALHLPHLPLELFGPAAGPLVIAEGPDNRPTVCARNRAAAACGIRPGQGLGAAVALCPGLAVRRRDADAEAAALQGLAVWAQQFTPLVHLPSPSPHPWAAGSRHGQPTASVQSSPASGRGGVGGAFGAVDRSGLLLEVEGSLHLFGGAAPLCERAVQGLRGLGFHPRSALAPTPLGAWLLARRGGHPRLTQPAALAAALEALPLTALELPPTAVEALHGMGLRRLADLNRLPRAGLARRLGPALLDHLDRALGRRPDPRPAFTPPERFAGRVPLPAETENSGALIFPARRLVGQLVGLLRAKGCGVLQLDFALEHRGRPPTPLTVGLMRPSRDPEHLLALLRERLDRLELPAPVDVVALDADRFVPLEQTQQGLFAATRRDTAEWGLLAEKLAARLGPDAVGGVQPWPDHRPERAWRPCPPGTSAAPAPAPPRPLWLLADPRPLAVHDEQPCDDGPLRLEGGPERLESGWWDGADAARDYFVAVRRDGTRLWVYRDRRAGGWFVQGVFG